MKKILMIVLGIVGIVFLFWLIAVIGDEITLRNSEVLAQYGGDFFFEPDEANRLQQLTKAQALSDFDWMSTILLEVHPKLQDKKERDLFQKKYWEIVSELTTYFEAHDLINVKAFYFYMARLCSFIDDAHTNARYLESFDDSVSFKRLPFEVECLVDGVVISELTGDQKNHADYEWLSGTELTAINGISIDLLMKKSHEYISGENVQWKEFVFSLYCPYAWFLENLGIYPDENGEISLSIKDINATEREIKLSMIEYKKSSAGEPDNWYDYSIDTDQKTGCFKIDKSLYSSDFVQAVDLFFADVKENEIEKIVIDLRENLGGSTDYVASFLKYIATEKVRTFKTETSYCGTTIRYRGITNVNRFLRLLNQLTSFGHARYAEVAAEDKFHGDIYILTSKKTFSSGNYFAVLFSDNQLATIVGESTGNSPSAYGSTLDFYTPNSGLLFKCSYKKFTRPNEKLDPAEALEPDVLIPFTVEAYQKREDPHLNWIRERK